MSGCFRVGSGSTVLRPIALSAASLALALSIPATLHANSVVLKAASNADLSDTTGNGTFNTTNRLDLASHGLYVTQFENGKPGSFEDRAVIVFNLAALPSNSQIKGLTFNFDETSYANAVGTIAVNGYASNGTISLADATAAASTLGAYDAIALGLGQHSVSLDPALLQSILGSSPYLGIRLQGTQYSNNTSLGSIEQSSAFSPPSLTVTFAPTPEPTSLALLGITAGLVLRRRRAMSACCASS